MSHLTVWHALRRAVRMTVSRPRVLYLPTGLPLNPMRHLSSLRLRDRRHHAKPRRSGPSTRSSSPATARPDAACAFRLGHPAPGTAATILQPSRQRISHRRSGVQCDHAAIAARRRQRATPASALDGSWADFAQKDRAAAVLQRRHSRHGKLWRSLPAAQVESALWEQGLLRKWLPHRPRSRCLPLRRSCRR